MTLLAPNDRSNVIPMPLSVNEIPAENGSEADKRVSSSSLNYQVRPYGPVLE